MRKFKNYIGLLLLACFALVSCEKDPVEVESPYKTVLHSIKILNAGEQGNVVVEGTVDEITKKVTFPRLDKETDLRGIKFEAVVSEGASLDSLQYDFVDSKERIIYVVNNVRKRGYLVTIGLDVPLFGADFTPANVNKFDFSLNSIGSPIYPDFVAQQTRNAHFDGEHVLVVSRDAGGNPTPHLLTLASIKATTSPAFPTPTIPLKLTGVSGGTFAVSSGRLAQGRVYISNLTTALSTSPLKIYYWATPTSEPVTIFSFDGLVGGVSINASARYGDNMSMDLDETGNGYIFLGDNPAKNILRLKVTGFTTVSEPTVIIPTTLGGMYSYVNQVASSPSEYIFTGNTGPIMLVSATGVEITKLTNGAVPLAGSDARVITFNEERYLIMTTSRSTAAGAESPTLYVYDFTAGNDLTAAFEAFEASGKIPLFTFSLDGIGTSSPSANTGWAEKDGKLYLFSAAPGSGFTLFELSKK